MYGSAWLTPTEHPPLSFPRRRVSRLLTLRRRRSSHRSPPHGGMRPPNVPIATSNSASHLCARFIFAAFTLGCARSRALCAPRPSRSAVTSIDTYPGCTTASANMCAASAPRFAQNGNLKAHMKQRHAALEKPRPFACLDHDCTKRFTRKSDAKRHFRNYHVYVATWDTSVGHAQRIPAN